jgi:hypothetical protein
MTVPSDIQLPRLRQAVLVAADFGAVCRQLETALPVRNPYNDPGVAEFGLQNAVYEVGDTFLEVVSPLRDGTTAGRYLSKHGGDAGYMAIFQVDDAEEARQRVVDRGIRTVWQADFDDIAGTHLHPRDIGGAIVSLDGADPPESWRWAGPRWTGGAPHDAVTDVRITGLTVKVVDVEGVAARWADVLDVTRVDGVTFDRANDAADEGIVAITIAGLGQPTSIGGVTFSG